MRTIIHGSKTAARNLPLHVHSFISEILYELRQFDVDGQTIKKIVRWLISRSKIAKDLTTAKVYMTEYQCWINIYRRCYNPDVKQFEDYGGRGIKMCDDWRDSFWTFYRDMGPRPLGDGTRRGEYSIDRIDNDADYSPANCKWSIRSEQQANRRVRKIALIRQ